MEQNKIAQLIQRYTDVYLMMEKKVSSMITEKLDKELTLDQYYSLRYINLHPGCTSTDLAYVCNVNKSAVTSMTNRLFTRNYIFREHDQADRRNVHLYVTPEGKDVVSRMEKQLQDLVRSYFEKLEEKEMESFIQTYEKIYQVIIEEEAQSTNESNHKG
ncbi:MarR family transcriptional regulator [Bacillus safensis]|uniref:MarR family winged helix-turn-helix transcriptional regulator n=1 Tax=Bacillus TaxID=1386 RepID=UPI00057EEAF0|nr:MULTISPECIES: MarR family transcriptional regulator [Bacillus]MBW4850853.1 MarR family transcriptional regulator [Bacillaceae bacterium]AIZ60243.1 MarR family transcriptional regulator [Bacillus sp. WP8]KMK70992.1 MarR family transcriptional regulator [Bacillus safensis]KUR60660.1 MarR family transcriptional regulator [Bacillus sp. AM 13(2015)]MBR0601226.1 MarR family transcriptional regulator [Bacillus safensis]